MELKTARTPWIDYLRGFITLLVVAHHSSLAYTTFASFNKEAYILSTHPVVDSSRSVVLDIFEDFNDIFFMSLMFLISGIFVNRSIQQKGTGNFIRDRFYRLFIPFVIGVTLLMLIAYYPAFYLAHQSMDIRAYVVDFFTVESWPVGPPWFIWVLFAFNLVFALGYPLLKPLTTRAGGWMNFLKNRPLMLLLVWFIITWLLYMPLQFQFGPFAWTGVGPFDFQLSRILLYFGYFLIGVLIGSGGLDNGLFAKDAALSRSWLFWLVASLAIYGILKWSEAPLLRMIAGGNMSESSATWIYRSTWSLSCTVSSIAFLTLFRRLFTTSSNWWQSLSANAYGIYLVHYIFVIWCQFMLLKVELPAVAKFLVTFFISVVLSWSLTFLIRKIGLIKRYL